MSIDRQKTSTLALWFIGLGAVAVAFAFLRGLNDSDLFWHLLNGQQLFETGRPVTADPYSFTFAAGYRTPHEWLAEGVMYGLISSIGPDLTLVIFATALPLGFAALGLALLSCGLPPVSIMFATTLAALVALPYASVRPQVLSWGLLAALVALLIVLEPRRRHLIWVVIPLLVLWANLHGLYAVGLAVIGWYALWTMLGRTQLRDSRLLVVGASIGAFLAGAATPSGLGGLLYPLRFLDTGDWGLANIPEWSSPNFHDAVQIPLLALIIGIPVIGRGRAPGWLAGLAYIGVVMALVANRNAPVAAVFAIPVLAHGMAQMRLFRGRPVTRAPGRRMVEIVATVLVVAGAVVTAVPRANGIQLDRFPVDAVNVLMARQPDARVLAEYGWGGYVAYRLHESGGRVFVDGRNDMYPERILNDYTTIRNGDQGWDELAESYRVEAILLPPDRALVKGVAQAEEWCEAYRDDAQVLMLPCVAGS